MKITTQQGNLLPLYRNSAGGRIKIQFLKNKLFKYIFLKMLGLMLALQAHFYFFGTFYILKWKRSDVATSSNIVWVNYVFFQVNFESLTAEWFIRR